MSEAIEDLRSVPRAEAYAAIKRSADAILEGVKDEVTAMATIAALLHHSLGFLWTGFYRVVAPQLLQVGPYQGNLGCIDIQFGRGVCGTCAAEKRTMVVDDVDKFPGHISCDARARSEIVVPVMGPKNNLIAVLDIDSTELASFGDDDRDGLERLVQWFHAN